MPQDTLMKFDPATGETRPYPSHAGQWRQYHGYMTAWLFNPWTGERRSAQDVGSDVAGGLILPPGEKLEAAAQGKAIRGGMSGVFYGPLPLMKQAEVDAHRDALRKEFERQHANPINPPVPFA